MQNSNAAAPPARVNLLSAPLEVKGAWGGSSPDDAAVVISRMREACLSGVRLLSDHQPDRLRVDDQASGPPHLWLHAENPTTAWIVVDIGTRAWSQLAYQFGHELGHVMCNSWMWKVETPPPSRWLEECLAEAFSIRGLGRLADAWEHNPPFPNDAKYGRSLRDYRRDLIEKYQKAGGPEPVEDVAAWLRANRALLDRADGLGRLRGAGDCDGGDRDGDRQGLRRGSGRPQSLAGSGAAFRSRSTCGCGEPVVRRSERPDGCPRGSEKFSACVQRANLDPKEPRLAAVESLRAARNWVSPGYEQTFP